MRVVGINGSPRKDGNTFLALEEMSNQLKKEGIQVEIVHVGADSIRGCIGCGYCTTSEENLCVFKDDIVNETIQKLREADGIIFGSPTYYAGIAGTMKSFLDRVFFTNSAAQKFKHKIGTSVGIARRAGAVDVVHQLNNYFLLAEMVVPQSQYWNIAFGLKKGEVLEDLEGMQTLRKNASAMAWLLKMKESTEGSVKLPLREDRVATHFIR
jgi:multimeric flavodoxin WrbA